MQRSYVYAGMKGQVVKGFSNMSEKTVSRIGFCNRAQK